MPSPTHSYIVCDLQVLKRFWRVTATMLVAACLALVRGVNDICKVDPEDPEAVEGCEGTSRWAGAWQILTEGWAEARRAATEGFEAIKQELRLYSAVGQPGLVTLQYMMNLIAPLRLEVMRADPNPSPDPNPNPTPHTLLPW